MTATRKMVRVLRRTLRTVKLRRFRRFGVRLELRRIVWTVARDMGADSAKSLGEKYHRLVKDWLAREFADVIERWRDPSANPPPPAKAALDDRPRIWTMWYQGMDAAPKIVQQCVASIERNRGDAELVVLDAKNLRDYMDIDPIFQRKIDAGIYTLAGLSDYIRLTLMGAYGGLWLDSTIFLSHPLDPQIFARPFYSVKFAPAPNPSKASLRQWAAYALGFAPGSPIAGFSRDLQLTYFQREDVLIDYFLIDYSLALGYETFPWFRALVDELPVNNADMYRLSEALDRSDADAARRAMEDENQRMHKTTYKVRWKLYPEDVLPPARKFNPES